MRTTNIDNVPAPRCNMNCDSESLFRYQVSFWTGVRVGGVSANEAGRGDFRERGASVETLMPPVGLKQNSGGRKTVRIKLDYLLSTGGVALRD